MQPPLSSARPDEQTADAPFRAEVYVPPAAAKQQQRIVVRAEAAQRHERPAVAVVGRGREQENERRASRNPSHRSVTVAVIRHAVSLVHDQQVPAA